MTLTTFGVLNSISGPVNIVRTGSAGIVGGCNIDGTIVSLTKQNS